METLAAEVTQMGGTVTYRVFDPGQGRFVGGEDSTIPGIPIRNQDGVVTWNDGSQVTPPHDKGIIEEVRAVRGTIRKISREDAIERTGRCGSGL